MLQHRFKVHCFHGRCFHGRCFTQWLIMGLVFGFSAFLLLSQFVGRVTPVQAQETDDPSTKRVDRYVKDALEIPWLHPLDARQILNPQGTDSPLCRFGINAPDGVVSYPVDRLRISWYQNYGTRLNPERPRGVEFVQTIRLSQRSTNRYGTVPSTAVISETAALNPGSIWFVGNEPDRKFFQDDIEPHLYAQAYHDLYSVIKAVDPTARVFAGSIVQPTPLRLLYLDKVLAAYRDMYRKSMPVDGWSIHNFVLNEASCEVFSLSECWGADIPPGIDAVEGLRVDAQDNDNLGLFIEQIERFRHWMWLNGYRSTPLYLSEYGVLMPQGVGFNPDFTPERVSQFMKSTFDYLLTTTHSEYGYPPDGNRLVQRFSWFSTDYLGFNGYVFDPESRDFTGVGLAYADYASTMQESVDFLPVGLVPSVVPIIDHQPVTLTVTAQIANSGNGLSSQPVQVRFYNGNPDEDGVQIGETQVVQIAGCGKTTYATVKWPDLIAGTYTVYVTVNGLPDSLAETGDALNNNVLSQNILIIRGPVFLPVLQK